MRYLLVAFATLWMLSGCGYRPSSHYAGAVVGDSVSTQVVISVHDPENSVIIKDALDRAVIERFKRSLSRDGRADTHIVINLKSIAFSPLRYDTNGYIITYETVVSLEFVRTTNRSARNYQARGRYDFSIEPNAIISDQARFEAIRVSASKAIDSFLAQVASEGIRTGAKP